MHISHLSLYSVILSAAFGPSSALKIPFKQSKPGSVSKRSQTSTIHRSSVLAASSSNSNSDLDLSTVNDLIYLANVTIAGSSYVVQLDTGSSDLWVQSTPASKSINTTAISYNLTYGIGWASGQVSYAPVTFASISVPSQAYLNVSTSDNPALDYGAVGILGLGFDSLSTIDALVNSTNASTGRSLLYNLFSDNPSEPNFIAFSLQRSSDPSEDAEGTFSIGEYDSNYTSVANVDPISTFPVVSPKRWSVLMDAILIGDQTIIPTTSVANAPSNKAVVLLDSGTSYTYLPTAIVNSIYGSISGANYDSTLGQWTVPCDAEVDMAFQIGGQVFPIHPLDVTPTSPGNNNQCVGSMIPEATSIGAGEFDYLIGDNFLRNVYSVYDFGDFDSNGDMGNPYVRLLALTDPNAASADFVSVRGGTARTNITYNVSNETAAASSTTTISTDTANTLNNLGKYLPIVLGITALNALALIGIFIALVVYMVKLRKSNKVPSRTPRGRMTPMPMNVNTSSIRDSTFEPQYAPVVITEDDMPMDRRNTFAGAPSLSQRSPSPMNPHPHQYNPVSMALTEDTLFAPPSPAYHNFPGDRPKSVA